MERSAFVLKRGWFLALVAILAFGMPFSSFAACDSCYSASHDAEQLKKSIQRLQIIMETNEEFIRGLDPRDESERMKASSNIRIAKKRITASGRNLKARRSELETPQCKKCFAGDKKDG